MPETSSACGAALERHRRRLGHLPGPGRGAGRRTRNAQVAAFRIALVNLGDGKVGLANTNDAREISEPGAKLQLTNLNTGRKQVVTLDDDGSFAANAHIAGQPGDRFSLAVSDGTNNRDFADALDVPPLVVPETAGGSDADLIADPVPIKSDQRRGVSKYDKESYRGPLVKDGFKDTDPQQGMIGDCYFPSAIAALGLFHAKELEKAVVDHGDGTYTVHFKQRDFKNGGGAYRDVPVHVDGDLYTGSWGGPVYGASTGSQSTRNMRMLFPLVEKAYATWKGGYDKLDEGGLSSDVFEAILGKPGHFETLKDGDTATAWRLVTRAIDERRPISAATYGRSRRSPVRQHRRLLGPLLQRARLRRRHPAGHPPQPLGRERARWQRSQ